MKPLLCILSLAFSSFAFSYSHIHPVPSLPKTIDLYRAADVFSISVLTQIHETLFKIRHNKIEPNLVKNFNVTADGKKYEIFLVENRAFHNGKILSPLDVKYSLESAIKNRAPGFEKLDSIVGYDDFLQKGDSLRGIETSGSSLVRILLNRPNPNFLLGLTEFRFAIIPSGERGRIGLGPYLLGSIENSIILRASKKKPGQADELIFAPYDFKDALTAFKKNEVHDLFAYPIDESYASQMTNAIVKSYLSPRIFVFTASPIRLKKSERARVLRAIDRQTIIAACYPGNVMVDSIIPHGFVGFRAKDEDPSDKKHEIIPDKLKIVIARGVGSEACLKKQLSKTFPNARILISDTEEMLKARKSGESDLSFFYLECENTLDFFQFFNPEAHFTLGVKEDKQIGSLLKEYNELSDPGIRSREAIKLNEYLLSHQSLRPVFQSVQYLVYNNRYEPLNISVQSVATIRFDEFIRRTSSHE